MRSLPTILLISCLCGAAGASAAAAPAATTAAPRMSMDQAVKMAEQRFHARVVKAEAQQNGTQTTYVLRLLNEAGKVWTVHVDAASGSMQ